MEEYIKQLKKTLDAELPYFTLMGTLVLIDICSALNSTNGKSNNKKFKNWYNTYLSSYTEHIGRNNPCDFNAEECYKLRCRILHQGRAEIDCNSLDKSVKTGKIAFRLGPGKVHKCNSNGLFYLDIETFMEDVINGVKNWEIATRENFIVKKNKQKMLQILDYDPGRFAGDGTYIY